MPSGVRGQGGGPPGEAVGRQRVGDDQDSVVRPPVPTELNGEPDETVAI